MYIGILTFHFGYNYGAILQCYALQQYLKSCGHEVKIIDFIPSNAVAKPYWLQVFTKNISIKKIRKIFIKLQYGTRHKEAFKKFREDFLNLTERFNYEKLSNLSDEFNAIIVGSDQIWNPSQHKFGSYFLEHLDKYRGRRISYAPCCALNQIDNKYKDKIIRALLKFSSISVRNKETEDFVYNLINEKVAKVLDPTFLWDFGEILDNKRIIEYPYILAYILGKEIEGGHKKVIDKIKESYRDAKIVSVILTENNPQIFNWTDKTYWFASPSEWLNLLFHSSFVYSDSFHGLIFSIKFKKPFLAYYTEKSRASRFKDLAERIPDISNSIVISLEDAIKKNTFKRQIRYEEIDNCLKNEIENSEYFLLNSLK